MGLLLDNRIKGKKIHEVKARKHITLMMIPDPTKSAKVVKIPKLPILICCIILVGFVIGGAGYVIKLTQQVGSTSATMTDKDILIAELESTTKEHYEKLQQLQTLATDLDGKVKELETYKQEMSTKISSTDSAPAPQQSETIVVEAAETMKTFAPGTEPSLIQGTNQPIESFDEELEKVSTSLKNNLDVANENISEYQQLNSRLDEILPAWEARPTGSPVANIVINDNYGWRTDPINGRTEFHTGIDLKAKYVPIYATSKGKVLTAGYESGYGYTVLIDHGYGYKTLYAHNSKHLVEVGDTVAEGEQIAVSGSSGRVTGPHLHYEVIYNGETKDPINYIF